MRRSRQRTIGGYSLGHLPDFSGANDRGPQYGPIDTKSTISHYTSREQAVPRICRSRSRKPLPRAGRQAQPEPSRPLPLTAIIGRIGHFIDAVIFRRAGGDETYGGEGGCDVKDVMDFQPNEYLTKVTQEWKWRDGVRWEGTCVRFPATV